MDSKWYAICVSGCKESQTDNVACSIGHVYSGSVILDAGNLQEQALCEL